MTVSFSTTADIFPFFAVAAGLCGAAFRVDLTGAGRAAFLAAGLATGFFATTFFAGLTGLRDAAFGAGLCAGFLAAGFWTGLAGLFAADFFAAGLRLEFAMCFTNIVPQRSRVIA
ncbi:MAG TPA: hypothetical protein VLK26_01545 [Rudaea sp.]|nr:hypothetical protein [Rudaea sp.]